MEQKPQNFQTPLENGGEVIKTKQQLLAEYVQAENDRKKLLQEIGLVFPAQELRSIENKIIEARSGLERMGYGITEENTLVKLPK